MECPICLTELDSKTCLGKRNIINSPCCHQDIHHKCLDKWLIDNNTCPLCREILQNIPVPIGRKFCNNSKKKL